MKRTPRSTLALAIIRKGNPKENRKAPTVPYYHSLLRELEYPGALSPGNAKIQHFDLLCAVCGLRSQMLSGLRPGE